MSSLIRSVSARIGVAGEERHGHFVYQQRDRVINATHMSLIVDDGAAGTTQAILDVVSWVRSVPPLVR